MDEFDGARGTVVSLDEAAAVKHGNRTIEIVPAWRWLLT